jgi:hypothetical protein
VAAAFAPGANGARQRTTLRFSIKAIETNLLS